MLPEPFDMTVKEFIDRRPETLPVFRSFGFHDLDKQAVRDKLGPFLKLKTLLKYRNIDSQTFAERCRTASAEAQEQGVDHTVADIRGATPTVLALLPCGLKVSLDKALQDFVEQLKADDKPLDYLAEGNVNHELSYYPYVDSVESIDELPDVLLSSDLNSLYHHRFLDRFVKPGNFASVNLSMHPQLAEIGYADPHGHFTMFCANVLVLVRVKNTTSTVAPPIAWGDLLQPEYRKSIIMRGQDSFFCSGVLVPFFKLFGIEAIPQLAANVCAGLHPSQMVKLINSGSRDIPPFFIMPWFFTRKIKDADRVEVLFPEEGAFISPVQLLVKKKKKEELAAVTDFLLSEQLQQHCADNLFPAPHPAVRNRVPAEKKLYWIGWDFIYANDLEQVKSTVGELFSREFLRTGGATCS